MNVNGRLKYAEKILDMDCPDDGEREMREHVINHGRLYDWLRAEGYTSAVEAERLGVEAPPKFGGATVAELAEWERQPPDEELDRFFYSLDHNNLTYEQLIEALTRFGEERAARGA